MQLKGQFCTRSHQFFPSSEECRDHAAIHLLFTSSWRSTRPNKYKAQLCGIIRCMMMNRSFFSKTIQISWHDWHITSNWDPDFYLIVHYIGFVFMKLKAGLKLNDYNYLQSITKPPVETGNLILSRYQTLCIHISPYIWEKSPIWRRWACSQAPWEFQRTEETCPWT